MADQWYYRLFGTEFGPVSRPALEGLIESGQLSYEDEIRPQDSSNWVKIRDRAATRDAQETAEDGTVISFESLPTTGLEPHTAVKPAPADQWYYQTLSQDWGPVSFDELLQIIRNGDVGPDDSVRLGATAKWRRAGSIGRLMAVMPYQSQKSVTPTPQQPQTPAPVDDELEFNLPQAATPNTSAQAAPGTVGNVSWYAWVGGREYGPVELAQLMVWTKEGRISSRDYIKHGQNSQWTPVTAVPGLIPQASPATAPVSAAQTVPVAAVPRPAAVSVSSAAPTPSAKPSASPTSASITALSGAATVAVKEPAPKTPTPPSIPATPGAPGDPMKATEIGFSAATSFSGSSANLGGSMTRGATAKKWTPPGKGKKASTKGFSGKISWEFLKDVRVWGVLAGVLLAVGLGFGWTLLPESSAKFQEPYSQLSDIFKEVETKVASEPSEADWKAFGAQIEGKLKPIKQKLTELKDSKHPAREQLTKAAGSFTTVLKKNPENARTTLAATKKRLDDAAKSIGVSP